MCVWRDTNATHIVLGCDDLSSAACAVRIVYETRQRQVLVKVEVVRGARLKSIDQVRVRIVDTVVNQGDGHALATREFPGATDMQVMARYVVVQQVPLLVKEGVFDVKGFRHIVRAVLGHWRPFFAHPLLGRRLGRHVAGV